MNNEKFIILNEAANFTMIPNKIIKEPSITSDAIAICVFILSNKPTFQIRKGVIMNRSKIKAYSFNKAWKLLIQLGYLHKKGAGTKTKWYFIV